MPTPSGEVTLKINDTEHTLRPSFKFITRVEDMTNTSITEIVTSLALGKVRYGYLAVVVQQGIIAAGGKPPSFDEIGEWLRTVNHADVVEPIAKMLTEALHAGPKTP